MTSDRSMLGDSRLALQILEYLFDAERKAKRPRQSWVNHHTLREYLIDEQGWGSCRNLREGPGRRYTAYFDGVLALLEELGCVRRLGWFYRFWRCLRHDDFAPIVQPEQEQP